MLANKYGRGSNTWYTQSFIYRRPRNQSALPSTLTQIQPSLSTRHCSSGYPTIVMPIPTPVLQLFILPQIQSDSSSGTLELTGQVHQPFLPEALYLSPGIPTQNSAKLQAFVNYCRFIIGNHQNRIINHSIADLYEITPAPMVFAGYLWRYRITISTKGILENYRIIAHTTSLPVHATLQYTFTVFYDWQGTGYTISLNEWASGKGVKHDSPTKSQ